MNALEAAFWRLVMGETKYDRRIIRTVIAAAIYAAFVVGLRTF